MKIDDFTKACVALGICIIGVVLALPDSKIAAFGEPETQFEFSFEESAEAPETAQILRRREVVKAAEIVAETEPETVPETTEADAVPEPTEPETTVEPEPVTEAAAYFPIYCYKNRDYLDEDFQRRFYEAWISTGMPESWYVYMIGLIYQECAFNIWSEHQNPDGSRDVGYFQYNSKWYYSSADKYGRSEVHIGNMDDQIWLFCQQMRMRYDKGLTMEEAISCHRRGDYDAYDAEYVAFVKERTVALVRLQ